jgi:hypothetical protein
MTLGEAKNKVYMLLDEHSTFGEISHDADIERKMTAFLDTAQKLLAQIKKIVRTDCIRPTLGQTAYGMPSDFAALHRIFVNGRDVTRTMRWRGGKLIIPEGSASEVLVEYFAHPETIPEDAPDSYVFEIAPDACECLPYYAAAQQLLPDPVVDSSAMLEMFDRAAARLDTSLPGEGLGVRQSLWRG